MSQADQVCTYDPAASVVFLKTNERFGGLLNMAPGFPLRVNGVPIRTSEALYQVCRFPHLPDVQRKIINEHSPMSAKIGLVSAKELINASAPSDGYTALSNAGTSTSLWRRSSWRTHDGTRCSLKLN